MERYFELMMTMGAEYIFISMTVFFAGGFYVLVSQRKAGVFRALMISSVFISLIFLCGWLICCLLAKPHTPLVMAIETRVPLLKLPFENLDSTLMKEKYRGAIYTAIMFKYPIPTLRMIEIQEQARHLADEQTNEIIETMSGSYYK